MRERFKEQMGQHCPFTLVVCLLSYTGGMALEGLCQCPPAGDCFITHLHDDFHTHHFLRAYFPSQCLFSFSALACCPSICPWLLSQTPAFLRATGLCELLPFFVCFLCKGLKLLFVLHSSLWVGSTPQPAVVRWIILLLSKSKGRVSFCLNLPNVLSGFSLHPCPRYFHVLEITSEIRGYLTLSNCSICPIQRMSAKYLCH